MLVCLLVLVVVLGWVDMSGCVDCLLLLSFLLFYLVLVLLCLLVCVVCVWLDWIGVVLVVGVWEFLLVFGLVRLWVFVFVVYFCGCRCVGVFV